MLLHRLAVWYKMCVIRQIGQMNNYMYSKVKGKSFKYQNTETD